MKRAIFLPLLCLALAVMAQPRQEIYLEKGWRFTRGDISGAADPAFDDSRWESVEVPHDWAIYGPFDKEIDKQVVAIEQNGETVPTEKTGRTGALPYIGVGWYRTTFAVPSGRRATLVFDGAMSRPIIYVNGKEVGRWAYGYTPFYIDVTPYLIIVLPCGLKICPRVPAGIREPACIVPCGWFLRATWLCVHGVHG